MQEHVVEAKAVLAKWSSASDGTACYLEFGQDHWMADLDQADRGHATPHEILDAALASCTALSLQLYVKHKGWRVSRIGVAVAHKHARVSIASNGRSASKASSPTSKGPRCCAWRKPVLCTRL